MVAKQYQASLPPQQPMEIEYCVYEGKGLVKRYKHGLADAVRDANAAGTGGAGGGKKGKAKK